MCLRSYLRTRPANVADNHEDVHNYGGEQKKKRGIGSVRRRCSEARNGNERCGPAIWKPDPRSEMMDVRRWRNIPHSAIRRNIYGPAGGKNVDGAILLFEGTDKLEIG